MVTKLRFPSWSTRRWLLLPALLAGCGPHVVEEDNFIEERCGIWCDGLEPCEHRTLSRSECFSDCVESESWTDACREARAAYHDCLLEQSCEELEERTNEGVLGGEDLVNYACYDEMHEASVCRSR